MNRKMFYWLFALFIGSAAMNLKAQGTSFFYQGHLNDSGNPANGVYDFVFSLYDAPTNGNAISFPQTNLAVTVASGLFTTNINFGAVFTGTNYWLAIGVRTNGNSGSFTLLWPRQPLLPVPYAIFANTASNLSGTLPAAQLSGTLAPTSLAGTYSGVVSFTNSGNSFSGNGTNLTNLNASQLTSGTVADVRLSTNVALLNGSQAFSGTNVFTSVNSFTSRSNSFIGSFFGNGLVGWIPVTGVSTQAMPDAGYLLLNSNLTTVTLPATNLFLGDIVRVSGAGLGGWQVAQNTNQSIIGIFLNSSNSTWVQANATSAGWQTVASSADGVKMVAAASGGGGIYASTDSGQSWGNVSTLYSPQVLASSSDGTRLVGVVNGGSVILSTNSGSTWKAITPGTVSWSGVTSSADGSKFAACISNSTIYVWSNYGAVSNFPASPVLAAWSGIACSADCSLLAATIYGGGIYTSVNSGSSWNQSGAGSGNWSCIASSADGNKLVAAIHGGNIYTSVDAGAHWTKQTNAPSASWTDIACSSDGGRIVAVANTGNIYVSANFGLTWAKQSAPTANWQGVACSADGTKMAAGYAATTTSGEIYYWQAASQFTTTTSGVNGSITGPQGSALELQYIGNGQWMPVSSAGTFWAN